MGRRVIALSSEVTTMRDGTQLGYTMCQGSRSNGDQQLVLIHSLAMDRSFWNAVVSRLPEDIDVLVYDCRGHGRSEKSDKGYTTDLFADDLSDLMDAVGWPSAVVAGASMGGCVALAFAIDYAERVTGLGLFDTTAYYGDEAPAQWLARAEKAVDEGFGALAKFQQSRWFGEVFLAENPDTVADVLDIFMANDAHAYKRTCIMLGNCDTRPGLASLTMPVRILVGSHDYATPVAMAEVMASAIPDARLRILQGGHHFTPIEMPDEITSELTTLIQETSQI